MKIIYAGTPEVATYPLEYLAKSQQVEVLAVLTREDAPLGRKRVLTPSPVAQKAAELGLPIIKTNRWTEETAAQVAALQADAAAVVAFGAILPQDALDLLPQGWINLHFSSLPNWRGAAPVQRALMAGETEIFSNTFRIEAGLDTGPVFLQESTQVQGQDTAADILNRLAHSGGQLLEKTFTLIQEGHTGTPQSGTPSHAAKMTLADGKINWADSTASIIAQVRGVTPEPGAWCTLGETRFKLGMVAPSDQPAHSTPGTVRLHGKKVLVTCGDGSLELTQVQPAGKKMMNAADWARGLGATLTEEKVVLA